MLPAVYVSHCISGVTWLSNGRNGESVVSEGDFHPVALTVAGAEVLRLTFRLAGAGVLGGVPDAEALVGVRVLCHDHTLTRTPDIATPHKNIFL